MPLDFFSLLQGRNNAGNTLQFSPISSSTFNQNPISCNSQQPGSSALIGESYEQYHSLSSPGSVEISSDVVFRSNNFGNIERAEEVNSSPEVEMTHALRRLEEQLSLNDETVEEIHSLYTENKNSRGLENTISSHTQSATAQGN